MNFVSRCVALLMVMCVWSNGAWADLGITDINISNTIIAENRVAGTDVGTLTAIGLSLGAGTTYELVAGTGSADNAKFKIVGDKLQTNVELDFETQSLCSVLIRATNNFITFEKSFTINVTNENDAPTGINLSNSGISENNLVGATIGTLSATDPDTSTPASPVASRGAGPSGGPFTYALVAGQGDTDNANFSITGDQLSAAVVFDFETKSTHFIRVKVTDAGGLSFETEFKISVFNRNDPPSNILLTPSTIAENSAAGTQVGVLSTVDPDGTFIARAIPQGSYTYQLVAGAGDTDNAAVQLTGDKIALIGVADFETKPTYSIRVRTTEFFDVQGALTSRVQFGPLSFEKAITISVTDVNEPFTAESLSATPNPATVGQSVLFTVVATDPENALQFSYDYGDGQSGASSTHTYGAPGVYTVVVTLSDGSATTKTLSTVVTVVAAAEPPPADLNGDDLVNQMDDDADKDGFPDNLETGFGTSPSSPGSTPTNAKGRSFNRFRITRVSIKPGTPDVATISGILNVPSQFTLAGAKLVFDVGGNVRGFTLDETGFGETEGGSVRLSAKSGARLTKEARFTLKLSGQLLANLTANAPKNSAGKPTQVTVNVLFNGVMLSNFKAIKKLK